MLLICRLLRNHFLIQECNPVYLVAESLAGQAKLSSTHFDRHVALLFSTASFGLAHNPGREMTYLVRQTQACALVPFLIQLLHPAHPPHIPSAVGPYREETS